MLVEVIGPNGSGKATLARGLSQAGVAEVVRLTGHANASAIRALLCRPRFAVTAVRAGLHRDRSALSAIARRDAALAALEPGDVPLLVDEGAWHGLLSHCARGTVPAEPAAFTRLRRPHVFLVVRAPVSVCVERLRTKHAGHWAHQRDDASLGDVVDRYLTLMDDVVSEVDVEVCEVDTHRASDPVGEVAERLQRHTARSRRRP